MPILLIALLLGVLAYLFWRRKTTTLTRNCRWRLDRDAGKWRCAYCGQQTTTPDGSPPKICAQPPAS